MLGTRKKNLKTGFPNGKRIMVIIAQTPGHVLISSDRVFDFLESAPEIKNKDSILNKVNFYFRDGQFHMKCNYNQYSLVLITFTEYIEEMIFTAMLEVEKREAKNDNKNSGNDSDTDSGRSKNGDSSGDNVGDKKKGFKSTLSSILPSTRGGKSPKGSGGDSK